jgi:hypothetical protein
MEVLRDGAVKPTESEDPIAGMNYLTFILHLVFRSVHGCRDARREFSYNEKGSRGHAVRRHFSTNDDPSERMKDEG